MIGAARPHEEEVATSPLKNELFGRRREGGTADDKKGLLYRAERLLKVGETQFNASVRQDLIKEALKNSAVTTGRIVKSLPLAVERINRPHHDGSYLVWTGTDTVLGDVETKNADRFELLEETLVKQIGLGKAHNHCACSCHHHEETIEHAVLSNLKTGQHRNISAKVGDNIRLWEARCNRLICIYQ